MSTQKTTKKVAVLGGGIGSLAAAFELSDPAQSVNYEITVYQLGWRLGGKGASGRNEKVHDRNEEHGLHVFLGFYDNAFNIMQRCYAEITKTGHFKNTPIDDWTKAFLGHGYMVLMEYVRKQWIPWEFQFDPKPGTPGKGRPSLSLIDFGSRVLEWLRSLSESLTLMIREDPSMPAKVDEELNRLPELLDESDREWAKVADSGDIADADTDALSESLKALQASFIQIDDAIFTANAAGRGQETTRDRIRRGLIQANFALANFIGFLVDRLASRGVQVINDRDYRDWLKAHGAVSRTLESALIRGFYDLVFAYPNGDVSQRGNAEAGYMLKGIMSMDGHRGDFFWHMAAGMGDVVFAPLYKVLQQRGVTFRFFHRVTDIVPNGRGDAIETVEISRQVTLDGADYDPLIVVNGLPCWPIHPDYDQIKEGKELQQGGHNLESFWTKWTDKGGTLTLTAGTDFDYLVLGIPSAAHPFICPSLLAHDSSWRTMTQKLSSVQTQSVEAHFKPNLEDMGWEKPPPIATAYNATPLNTWADLTHVIKYENWGRPKPENKPILCGPMKGPAKIPPANTYNFPGNQQAAADTNADEFFATHGQVYWPDLYPKGSFDPTSLVVEPYVRANIDPTARYIQTPVGSSTSRKAPDNSGYSNMFLAGDWTDNGQNFGNVESSVTSGRMASRGISGKPATIFRERYLLGKDRKSTGIENRSSTTIRSTSSAYVNHPGFQTHPGDFVLNKTTFWGFFTKGERDPLRRLCRMFFDEPTNGAIKCSPVLKRVLIAFVDAQESRFLDFPDLGYCKEQEVAIWILCRIHGDVDSHLALFNPYMFVDNPVALMTGREMYGFRKQAGRIAFPSGANQAFALHAFGTKTTGSGYLADWYDLLKIECDTVPKQQSEAEWPDAKTAFMHMFEDAVNDDDLIDDDSEMPMLLRKFIDIDLPIILFKQFRGAVDGTNACFQSVNEISAEIQKFHGIKFARQCELAIYPFHTNPLEQSLGISSGRTHLNFKLSCDLKFGNRRELWRAS